MSRERRSALCHVVRATLLCCLLFSVTAPARQGGVPPPPDVGGALPERWGKPAPRDFAALADEPGLEARFLAARNFTAPGAVALAAGDFNSDGKQDLVVVNSVTNEFDNMEVLFGDGAGHFESAKIFGMGKKPAGVAPGDFNGDGKLDLAAADFETNQVAVRLGSGTGEFAATTTFAAGEGPVAVLAEDMNGDNKLDLVVANEKSNNLSVLLGDGAGGFGLANNLSAGTSPADVAAGDFNNDGRLDLAAVNAVSNSVSILLATAAGSFTPASPVAVGTNPRDISAGDLNHDGKMDLVVANLGSNDVSLLAGDGRGGFSTPVNFSVPGGPRSLDVADLNGDGLLDMAVAEIDSHGLSILLGNRQTGLKLAGRYAVGPRPSFVLAGDYNEDGKVDLAVANSRVSVLLGLGAGAFYGATSFDAGDTPRGLAVGDFNRDGNPDLAVANFKSDDISILWGNGRGGFSAPAHIPVGKAPVAVGVGDFNGDGKADLAVANTGSNDISVLLGNGLDGFGPAANFSAGLGPPGWGPASITVADVNQDGRQDILGAIPNASFISLLYGDGTGSFAQARQIGGGRANSSASAVGVGDFNDDGRPDLAVSLGFAHIVAIHLAKGTGGFSFPPSFLDARLPGFVSNYTFGLVVEDLDRDGKLDLAVATQQFELAVVFRGIGAPFYFELPRYFGAGAAYYSFVDNHPSSIATGDFNLDGITDLVVAGPRSDAAVLLGTGQGNFSNSQVFAAGFSPESVAVGDFNSDGRPDLAVANDHDVSILLNVAPLTPLITGLSPAAARAGVGSLSLTVNGENFIPGATVRLNNRSLLTTFISKTELFAVIPAADLRRAGAFLVTVINPEPGGGRSGPRIFRVIQAPTAG